MAESALERLMGSYYHQDFVEVSGGVWEALDDFMADDPLLAEQLPDEIARILEHADEAEVERILDTMGSCVYMGDDEAGYTGWLQEISRRVRSRPDTQSPRHDE